MPRVELNSVEEFQTHVMEFFNADEEIKCELVKTELFGCRTSYYKTTSTVGGWTIIYDISSESFSVYRRDNLDTVSALSFDLETAVRSCCMKMDRKIFEAAQSITAMTAALNGLLARGEDCTIRDP